MYLKKLKLEETIEKLGQSCSVKFAFPSTLYLIINHDKQNYSFTDKDIKSF